MYKKIILILLLFTLISSAFFNASQAFFKRNKSAKKNSVKKEAVEEINLNKIILAEIFASWCPGCKNIQPTLDQLTRSNPDIELVLFDVSTPAKAKTALKRAEELKIAEFYNANKSKTATVAIIIPAISEVVSQFQNNNVLEEYNTAIEIAKTKIKEHLSQNSQM